MKRCYRCGKWIPESQMVCGTCKMDIDDGIPFCPDPPEETEIEEKAKQVVETTFKDFIQSVTK